MSKYLILYFVIINIASLTIMIIDKKKSQSRAWRIPESAIFSFAFIGGAVGTLLGMELFRHKTKHIKFKFGIPLLVIINLIIYYFVLSYINVS